MLNMHCKLQVGNALTDDYNDHLGLFQFMWSAGLISDETYKLLNDICDSESFIHSSKACDKIQDIASNELGDIDPYSIYTPSCPGNVSQSNHLRKRMRVSRYFKDHAWTISFLFITKFMLCCIFMLLYGRWWVV